MSDAWLLYWLACAGGKRRVGISIDLEKRFKARHAGHERRATRAFRPRQVTGVQPFRDRGAVTRAEWRLNARTLPGKRAWARQWPFPVPDGGPG